MKPIFRRSYIPFVSAIFRVKVPDQKFSEDFKKEVIKVIEKILQLTSFALTTEHRWSFCKTYLGDIEGSNFAYSECFNRLPRLPDSHDNINDSRLVEFLNKSYNNYTDELNTKYNFSLALGWYLDSISSRYDVMRFISASTALESILDAFSTESEVILPSKVFCELRKKIEFIIGNEKGKLTPQEEIESMLKHLPNINRRSYRKKAERLLESLRILDDQTKESLKDVIEVRNQITHRGRFVSKDLDKEKVVRTYEELISLLTKIFLRILVPNDATFYQEFLNKTWKVLR